MKIHRLVFLFGLLVLFIGTASESSVTGKDEFWVTLRTPLEMIEDNSYWTLRLNDEVRLQKPPLIYWFIATMYHLFGIELWAARLVGVISGAGMAALSALLYRRLFQRSGFLVGILVLATAGVAVEGRRAMLDLPLGFFCLWSVYLALAAHQDRKRGLWAASGLALAAATLTKGPQSLLFVLPALLLGVVLLRPRPSFKQLILPALLFVGVFLLVALPWPLSMRNLHGDFIGEMHTQIVEHRINAVKRITSPLNALGAVLLLIFPWSFVLATGLGSLFKKSSPLRGRRELWLAGSLLLSVTPFFFMRAFERYMIPIIPFAALLTLRTLECASPRLRRILLLVSCSLLALVATVFALFGIWFHLTFWSSLFCMSLVAWMLWSAGGPRLDRPLIAAAWVFTFTLGVVYPRLGVNRLPNDLPWDEVRRHPVGNYSRNSQPAFLSMHLGRSVTFIREDRLNKTGFNGYIFTTADQLIDPDPADKNFQFLDHALRTAGVPWEEVGRYNVLFSRRTWINFTRPGSTWEDWKTALQNRSLSGLKSEIVYVKTGDLALEP